MAAYEDEALVLACLIQPWLGDLASEAVLSSTLGLNSFNTLIAAATCNTLGLPPSTPIPIGRRYPDRTSPQTDTLFPINGTEMIAVEPAAQLHRSTTLSDSPNAELREPDETQGSMDHAIAACRQPSQNSTRLSAEELDLGLTSIPSELLWACDVESRIRFTIPSPLRRMTSCVGPVTISTLATTAGSSTSDVSKAIHADPGMRSVCTWWQQAAQAITQDTSNPNQHLHRQDLALLLQRLVMIAIPRIHDGESDAPPSLSSDVHAKLSTTLSCDDAVSTTTGLDRDSPLMSTPAFGVMITLQDMQRFAGCPEPGRAAIIIPPISTLADGASAAWLPYVKRLQTLLGLKAASEGTFGDKWAGQMASLQHVCALGMGSRTGGSAVGGGLDWLVFIVHEIMGASDRTCHFLTSLVQFPVCMHVWPKLSEHVRSLKTLNPPFCSDRCSKQ